MATARRLHDLQIDEVSLVDRPANQHGLVAFAKRGATEEENMDELYDHEGNLVDPENLAAGDFVYGADGQEFQVQESDDDDGEDGEDYADLGYDGQREEELVGKSLGQQVLEELSKSFDQTDRDEVISKVADVVGAAELRARRAETIAKSVQDKALEAEFVEIAKSYELPVDPNELGPVLKRMVAALPAEDITLIDRLLQAAGESMYVEKGVTGNGQDYDSYDAVRGVALEAVGKAGISEAQAMVGVYETNPDAYETYLAEQRG